MRGQKRKSYSTSRRSTAPTPSAAVLSPPPPLTAARSRSSSPRHESPYSLDTEATPPHAAPPLPIPAQPPVATTAAAGGAKPACSSPRFESPSSLATVRTNKLPVAVGGWPQFEASLLLPRPIDPLVPPAAGTSSLGIQHKSESLSTASASPCCSTRSALEIKFSRYPYCSWARICVSYWNLKRLVIYLSI